MNELPNPTMPLSPVSLPRGSLHRPDQVVAAPGRGILVSWAEHQDEVRQAQRLRYQVFAGEMGARLDTSLSGHDVDLFDDYCEHLLVRDEQSQEVIGTYRVLTPAQALRVGSTYSDTEFDLTRLRALRERMVELGRSCVHPAHRHGGVILALWGALAEFMTRNQLDTMIGCASIPMLHNGIASGHAAASIWNQVKQTHLAPIEIPGAAPGCRCRSRELDGTLDVEPPALIKGYLRLGAKVLGAAGLGPGLQQRGPTDADANPGPAAPVSQALSGRMKQAARMGFSEMRTTFDALGPFFPACPSPCRPTWKTTCCPGGTAPSSSPTCTWARPAARRRRCSTSCKAHPSDYLYLVGDIVDGWQLRRRWYWPQSHNDVVQKLLRSARKGCRVVYVPGNHDEFARQFVGPPVRRHRGAGGGRARDRRRPAALGDPRRLFRRRRAVREVAGLPGRQPLRVHAQAQSAPQPAARHAWACRTGHCRRTSSRRSRRRSTTSSHFEVAVAREARRRGYQGVVCGHIHRAEMRDIDGILYCNDGDWVESRTALVEHYDGSLELVHWTPCRMTTGGLGHSTRSAGACMKIALVTDAWQPQVNGVVTTLVELVQGTDAGRATGEGDRARRSSRRGLAPATRESTSPSSPKRRAGRDSSMPSSPDAIHLATEGPLGWAGRALLPQAQARFHHGLSHQVPGDPQCGGEGAAVLGLCAVQAFPPPLVGGDGPHAERAADAGGPGLPQPAGLDPRGGHRACSSSSRGHGPAPGWSTCRGRSRCSSGRVSYEKNIEAFLKHGLSRQQGGLRRWPGRGAAQAQASRKCDGSACCRATNWPRSTRPPTSSCFPAAPIPSAWSWWRPWPAARRWRRIPWTGRSRCWAGAMRRAAAWAAPCTRTCRKACFAALAVPRHEARRARAGFQLGACHRLFTGFLVCARQHRFWTRRKPWRYPLPHRLHDRSRDSLLHWHDGRAACAGPGRPFPRSRPQHPGLQRAGARLGAPGRRAAAGAPALPVHRLVQPGRVLRGAGRAAPDGAADRRPQGRVHGPVVRGAGGGGAHAGRRGSTRSTTTS